MVFNLMLELKHRNGFMWMKRKQQNSNVQKDRTYLPIAIIIILTLAFRTSSKVFQQN